MSSISNVRNEPLTDQRNSILVSRYEDLETRDSSNILKTLFHREIGSKHPFKKSPYGKTCNSIFDSLLLRQLICSRNKMKRQRKIVPQKKSTKKNSEPASATAIMNKSYPVCSVKVTEKSITLANPLLNFKKTYRSGKMGSKDVVMIYEKLFLRIGEGYTCFIPQHGTLKPKYSIHCARSWKHWDVWSLPDFPIPDVKKRISMLLCTLSEKGNVFNAYYLETGEKFIGPIILDSQIRYANVLPFEETGRIVLPCMKSSLPSNLIFDCIMIDILELKNTIRFQIPKSAIVGKNSPTNASVFKNRLTLSFPKSVRIWDMFSLLTDMNCKVVANTWDNLAESTRVPITHEIQILPEPLICLPKNGTDFAMDEAGYPPHYITKRFVYDILTQKMVKPIENQPSSLKEILSQMEDDDMEQNSVEFHPDDSPRVLYHTRNSFCVASLRRSEDGNGIPEASKLIQEFYSKFDDVIPEELPQNSSPVPARRTSTRTRRASVHYGDPVTEDELTVATAYEWACCISALVMMEVTSKPPNFKFHFYDNESWNKILTIIPDGVIGKMIPSVDLSLFAFNVTDAEIIIKKNRTASEAVQVFIISLLEEVGSLIPLSV